MREFERLEISKWKCIICGCKNKVHTELLNDAKNFVGYRLKCCGCGNVNDFMLNYKENGKPEPCNSEMNLHPGRQRCIRMSYCPHKDCKLYNTHCDRDSHKHCNCTDTHFDTDKLIVEVIHKPNFL